MAQGSGPSFTRLFAGVLVALKLKESFDDYSKVATEEDGRVPLASTGYRDVDSDAESARLLETEAGTARPTRRKTGCCVCCGLDCTLFWKAFAIVLTVFAAWNAFRLIRWAVTPAPTGLEHMPVFSDSLGCLNAEYIFNGQPTSFNVPIGSVFADHGFDIRGGAVGTIVVLEGAPTATMMKYEISLRTNNRKLLDTMSLEHAAEKDAPVRDSHLRVTTGHPDKDSCIRFDIRIFIPPTLQKLHVAAHAVAHVQFDPVSFIHLDEFYTTLFTTNHQNMIIPHNNLRARIIGLEVFDGWIVGDVSVDETTKVTTQRGAGIMNVRVHPIPASDPANPTVASLRTTSGSGRTDVYYIDQDAHVHRPMNNMHLSSMNADMYFTYRDSHYRGRVELVSKSYSATGLQRVDGGGTDENKWTHWYGDVNGTDEIMVRSRGWVGVYF
ncbi:hypothetical protein MKEN_00875200 [Mycena kentingensis (nom. inval.)]|nr:hypothetical protein MKEN_00875200 [Mycena kentingensis (nom. inval.)]